MVIDLTEPLSFPQRVFDETWRMIKRVELSKKEDAEAKADRQNELQQNTLRLLNKFSNLSNKQLKSVYDFVQNNEKGLEETLEFLDLINQMPLEQAA